MTDHFVRSNAPASSTTLAELHRTARRDYNSPAGRLARATRYPATPAWEPEPTDLDVAISVAQQLLDSSSVLSLRESLRLLLRALGVEDGGV
jgi:hypothetical protein